MNIISFQFITGGYVTNKFFEASEDRAVIEEIAKRVWNSAKLNVPYPFDKQLEKRFTKKQIKVLRILFEKEILHFYPKNPILVDCNEKEREEWVNFQGFSDRTFIELLDYTGTWEEDTVIDVLFRLVKLEKPDFKYKKLLLPNIPIQIIFE